MAGSEPIQLVPAGGSRRPAAALLLILLALAIGLVKPWGSEKAPGGPTSNGRAGAPSAASAGPAGPSSSASLSAGTSAGQPGNGSGPCSYGLAWRLFTAETSDIGPVHTWYGLVPVPASGPTDPRIKVVLVHSTTIGQLGYCNVDIPGSIRIVETQAWRLVPGAGAQALALAPVTGSGASNPSSGVIYVAPGSPGASAVWTPAEYVFAVRFATSPATEAWFAVDIA